MTIRSSATLHHPAADLFYQNSLNNMHARIKSAFSVQTTLVMKYAQLLGTHGLVNRFSVGFPLIQLYK